MYTPRDLLSPHQLQICGSTCAEWQGLSNSFNIRYLIKTLQGYFEKALFSDIFLVNGNVFTRNHRHSAGIKMQNGSSISRASTNTPQIHSVNNKIINFFFLTYVSDFKYRFPLASLDLYFSFCPVGLLQLTELFRSVFFPINCHFLCSFHSVYLSLVLVRIVPLFVSSKISE